MSFIRGSGIEYNPRNIPKIFHTHMTENGAGGSHTANGNYSVTPANFELRPTVGVDYVVTGFWVIVEDVGTIDSGFYGSNITLTNGITLDKVDSLGASVIAVTNGEAVYTNAGWAHFADDVRVLNFGSGNDILKVELDFTKFGRPGIPLSGNKNEALRVVLNDDFTGLVDHELIAVGWVVP